MANLSVVRNDTVGERMRLLVLGGTGDAKRLTQALIGSSLHDEQQLEIIYSVAGLVRLPELECEVISGGFTQFGGLAEYIRQRGFDALLDATHPFALAMSRAAVSAAQETGIPCWRLERAAWQPQPDDDWKLFSNWNDLLAEAMQYQSVFISSGQLPVYVLASWQANLLHKDEPQRQLLRTAVAPAHELLGSMQWLKAIGPFEIEDELALMRTHGIECLITKNSGGQATEAKLVAARRLGVTVLMLNRPSLPTCDRSFETLAAAQEYIERRFL